MMPSSDSAGSTEYLDAISDIVDIVGLECLPVTMLKVAFHCGTLSLWSTTHGTICRKQVHGGLISEHQMPSGLLCNLTQERLMDTFTSFKGDIQ